MMKHIKTIILSLAALVLFSNPLWAGDQAQAIAYLWRMINEDRVHPLQTLQLVGIDEQTARQALGEHAHVLDTGLPPVAWNQELFISASAHNQDMIENGYYSYNSLSGETPAQRIEAAGYPLLRSGELLGVVQFSGYMDYLEAASAVFCNILKDELDPETHKEPVIFNPHFSEVGIDFRPAVVELAQGPPNIYMTVIDFAQPAIYRVFLVGNVYDAHQGLEGVDIELNVLSNEQTLYMKSWPLGAYQFSLPPGFLMLVAKDESGRVIGRSITYGGRENILVDVFVKR